jgi:hypothetical protein
MALTIKRIQLWRREVNNEPGALAETLEPLAKSGANLKVVMGYQFPGDKSKAAIEVYPVSGARASAAAQEGGLSGAAIPTLLVEGDNQAGLGWAFATSISDAGININFLVAQVLGNRFSAVIGFTDVPDLDRAATIIKNAVPRRAASKSRKKSTTKKSSRKSATARKATKRRR